METAMTDTIDESSRLEAGGTVWVLLIAAVVAIGLAALMWYLNSRRQPLETMAVDTEAAEVAVATEAAADQPS
jgi:hypothetical protein